MIRAIAGVLYRTGAPDDAGVALLRSAVSAEAPGAEVDIARSGALAVAFSGGPCARDGEAIGVLDGVIDAGIEFGSATDRLGADHAVRMEHAALTAWRASPDFTGGLRGDDALLLWDGARGVLIRDQLGGRSWVIHDDGAGLSFATEVSGLLRLLSTRPDVDEAAMGHWLAVSGMPGDRTLYEGVRRLEAGHLLDLDPAARRPPRRYWSPQPPSGSDRRSRAEVAAGLRSALETAVARRVTACGPSAVLLSGGLDSATVAGIATTLDAGERPRRAYSATFPGHPGVDESALIAELATADLLTSTLAVVDGGSVVAGGLGFLERWALPPVSPNLFFWTPLLQRATADGVRVMLDGEGGDELFGLSPYLITDRLRRGDLRGAAAQVRQVTGGSPDLDSRIVARYLLRYGVAGLPPAWAHALSRRVRRSGSYAPPWMSRSTARAFVATTDGAAWKRHRGPRWWGYLLDSATHGMGPASLYDHSRQRAALAGPLLPRHPIVDVDVIEFVLNSPPEFAFDPARSRPVVREAVEGLVPDSVRLRPDKSTFDALFHESLSGVDRPVVDALLGDPGARVGAYVDLAAVKREALDTAPPDGGTPRQLWALHIWRLVTAELFLRAQEDPSSARAAVEASGTLPAGVTITSG